MLQYPFLSLVKRYTIELRRKKRHENSSIDTKLIDILKDCLSKIGNIFNALQTPNSCFQKPSWRFSKI